MSDIEFVPGLIVKAPHERAPDFVKASISIKVEELGQFLREKYKNKEEWVNADIKVSKNGKWYCSVSNFKKEEKAQEPRKGGSSKVGGADLSDDIPFAPERDRY